MNFKKPDYFYQCSKTKTMKNSRKLEKPIKNLLFTNFHFSRTVHKIKSKRKSQKLTKITENKFAIHL